MVTINTPYEGRSVIVDSIFFKGHTCFKKEWSGFDVIKPINVIIGRNNSGKSHLLDLVEVMCSGQLDGRALAVPLSKEQAG